MFNKKIFFFAILILIALFSVYTLNKKVKSNDQNQFAEILDNPEVNSKEVGEKEGIKYFQIIRDGKTGFRDLDGNITIKPVFDNAEMFSEGLSAVQIGDKYGLIDEKGNYVLPLKNYQYLGSVHDGLASFRKNDKYGFININGKETIRPQFDWVSNFSEGLCAVRIDNKKLGDGKCGYIDTTGRIIINLKYDYATDFQSAQAKIELKNLWGSIDKKGKIIVAPTHPYATW